VTSIKKRLKKLFTSMFVTVGTKMVSLNPECSAKDELEAGGHDNN